mmetsp:Transcript_26839/g.79332  ORF Transcript_26839/g.79332 Transcript_26839/m.79332 type:complete len:94 (+) Transcript_26839:708-989(+)
MILPKLDTTSNAAVRCRLPSRAFFTDDFTNIEAIHRTMAGRSHLVVANPAAEDLVAARRYNVTLALVVHAAHGLLRQPVGCSRRSRVGDGRRR